MGLKKVKTRAGIFWEEMVRTLALWGALEREGVMVDRAEDLVSHLLISVLTDE